MHKLTNFRAANWEIAILSDVLTKLHTQSLHLVNGPVHAVTKVIRQ